MDKFAIPQSIKRFAKVLSELPSIGPRQALRLAFYVAESRGGFFGDLKTALEGMAKIKICQDCFWVHEEKGDLCSICENSFRNKNIIAIVEKATDLISLEKTGKFGGRYLILGDLERNAVMEPEQKTRIEGLKNFIREKLGGKATEIILAINPTSYGDLNAAMLETELQGYTQKISRLGRGIPTGGEIEFADEETLRSALERRN